MAIGGLLLLAKASHDASRLFGSFLLLASARKLQAYFNSLTTDLSELKLTTFGRRTNPLRGRFVRDGLGGWNWVDCDFD
ncbi:MAG: hypothetical protein CFE32_14410 [Alphaproteobacteria bacterium PA3]|nr:MAG: hypothetical protein CFE32_14410 [Alphaproteobacteria bacterium PA3]